MTTKYISFNRPKDWQAFERLTRDLFARIYQNPHFDLYGRSGQNQGGLDIFVIQCGTRKIGVQCKGRNDATFNQHAAVTEREFREAIADVRENFRDLDEFVFVTTGPNDIALKQIASDEGGQDVNGKHLHIEFHGWDWFEGHLSDHEKLAISYGLISVLEPKPVLSSEIARQIGLRLRTIVEIVNRNRGSKELLTVQSLSRHLGSADWRRLEAICDGTADVGFAELEELAIKIGVSSEWLIKGTSRPFETQQTRHWRGPMDLEKEIIDLSPRKIYFVREMSHAGSAGALVVLEVDDIRWHVFSQRYPIRGQVGAGGQGQIFEFLCLVRRLRENAFVKSWTCWGAHIPSDAFEALAAGECYPASMLRHHSEDPWWDDFADTSYRIDSESAAFRADLKSAVSSARVVANSYRDAAKHSSGHRALLEWAFLPVDQ